MKITIMFFIAILACSGCHINEKNYTNTSGFPMTRHDEIRKIMRDYWINNYETGDYYWWSAEERKKKYSELRKMKNDYNYELSDPNIVLTVPGPGTSIRGPLTVAQVEQDSIEEIMKSTRKDVPQVHFGFINDKWNDFKSKYKDGDDLYHYVLYPDGTQGYVLIRKNKIVDLFGTGTGY